jgi:dUTP pyrophosphatase
MLNVKFKKEHPDAQIPVKASKNAGAYDVVATEIIKESDDCYLVKLGFSVEFPPEYKLMISPRSSITKTKWNIQNSPGIGDADFRGEYSIRFRAFPDGLASINKTRHFQEIGLKYPEFPYKVCDRVAQIYFQKVEQVHFFETQFLNETERGSGAYGSTGK